LQSQATISTIFQQYLNKYLYRHPILFNSLQERIKFDKYYSQVTQQIGKFLANKLDPFNLCPRSIMFWFLIPPYSAIGVNILGLQKVVINWRQQIEPNETIYLFFRILELKPPFPLTLLLMFSGLGLVISDAAYRLIQATLLDNGDDLNTTCEQVQQTLVHSLDPFNLTPRMSLFFPIIDDHTSLGFLTIDFRHVEFSVKQALEPSENIQSLIRFLDLYTPFPLQVAIMLLSVGLFLTGRIYEFSQAKDQLTSVQYFQK
jgi:hypothetical protein